MKAFHWRTTRAWNLIERVVFPNESVSQRQNEFKDLAVCFLEGDSVVEEAAVGVDSC